jgi:hypothetical protein
MTGGRFDKYFSLQKQHESEPTDHALACEYVANFFKGIDGYGKFDIRYGQNSWHVTFPEWFNIKHDLRKRRTFLGHTFDVAIFLNFYEKPLCVFEVHQVCTCRIRLPTGRMITCYKSKHSKPQQKENDGVIDDYMENIHPNVKVYRPEKSDCFSYAYLWEQYKEYALL